jgi:hypothetical protein
MSKKEIVTVGVMLIILIVGCWYTYIVGQDNQRKISTQRQVYYNCVDTAKTLVDIKKCELRCNNE